MESRLTSFLVAPQINVGYNEINQTTSLELIAAMKGKKMVSIGMASCNLGVEGAKAMAELASVTPSVASVRASPERQPMESSNKLPCCCTD